MSSSALEIASIIADIDPTGIASKIFGILSKINEQYIKMQGNKETCQSLKKEVDLIGTIIKKLCETKQTGPCEKILAELEICLSQCLILIESIGVKKDYFEKVKEFFSAKANQEVITKLTEQLHNISGILDLALSAQAANSVEKMMGLMSEMTKKAEENLPSIQQCNAKTSEGVNRIKREIEGITITNNIYVQIPQSSSSDDRRDSILLSTEIIHIAQEKDRHILERLKLLFMNGRGALNSKQTRSMEVYNTVLRKHKATLAYRNELHLLYINNEPILDEKEVLKAIDRMIDSLHPSPAYTEQNIQENIDKRRASGIKNFSKKNERENMVDVLNELRKFFIYERDGGEKSGNFDNYEKYLKMADGNAELLYKQNVKKHILCINGKVLDSADAANALWKIIKNLEQGQLLSSDGGSIAKEQINLFKALQTILVFPKDGQKYVVALKELSDARVLGKIETEYLKSVRGRPVSIPLATEFLRQLPNLHQCIDGSFEYNNLTDTFLRWADAGLLTSSPVEYSSPALEHFQDVIIHSKSEQTVMPTHILLFGASILLQANFGANGKFLSNDTDERNRIKDEISVFLCERFSSSETRIPEALKIPLGWLKNALYSTDRSLRLQARDECQRLQIPINMGIMLALSVDGLSESNENSEDAVLVIGASGAGKSSTINYLCGIKYELVMSMMTGTPYLQHTPDQKPLARVGNSSTSQTLYPQIIPSTGFSFVDCPGFDDNRSDEQAACAALGVPLAVQHTKNIRAILVVIEWDAIYASRGLSFRLLNETLSRLINSPENLLDQNQGPASLIFAISKPRPPNRDAHETFDPDMWRDYVIGKIKDIYSSSRENFEGKKQIEKIEAEIYTISQVMRELEKFNNFSEEYTASGIRAQFLISLSGESQSSVETGKIEQIIQSQNDVWKRDENVKDGAREILVNFLRQFLNVPKSSRKPLLDEQKKKWEEKSAELEGRFKEIEKRTAEKAAELAIYELMLKSEENIFIIRGHVGTQDDMPDDKRKLLNHFRKLREAKHFITDKQFRLGLENEQFKKIRRWIKDSVCSIKETQGELLSLPKEIDRIEKDMSSKKEFLISDEKQLDIQINYCKSGAQLFEETTLMDEITKNKKNLDKLSTNIQELRSNILYLEDKKREIVSKLPEQYDVGTINEERNFIGRAFGKKTTWHYSCFSHFKIITKKGFFRDDTIDKIIPIEYIEIDGIARKFYSKDLFDGQIIDIPSRKVLDKKGKERTIVVGNITINDCDFSKGRLKITYESGSGENGKAEIRIFVLHKDTMSGTSAINEIDKKIKKIFEEIDLENSNIDKLRKRLDSDKEYINLLQKGIIEDPSVRLDRIRAHRTSCGYDIDKFIDRFFPEVKNQLLWLKKTENLEKFYKLAICNEQWIETKLKMNARDLAAYMKRNDYVQDSSFSDIEADKLYSELPEGFERIFSICHSMVLTVQSLYTILNQQIPLIDSIGHSLQIIERNKWRCHLKFEIFRMEYKEKELQIRAMKEIIRIFKLEGDPEIATFQHFDYNIEKEKIMINSYQPIPEEIKKSLLEEAENINKPDKNGLTPICFAAQEGCLEEIRTLVGMGANIHIQSLQGKTPVYIAAENGHAKVIAEFHALGANVNMRNHFGKTPVFIAAQNGHVEAILALHTANADVKISSTDGTTPIYAAAQNGHAKVIAELHALGADANTPRSDKSTPVFIAAQNGHAEAIVALHAAGANVDTPMPTGATPVYIAAQQGHAKVIRALHEAGANVNMPALDGWAPVLALSNEWRPEMMFPLKNLDENMRQFSFFSSGWTPMFVAALMGQTEAIRALKDADANVNTSNKNGETPVFIAAKMGHVSAITALHTARADMNTPSNDNTTPVYIAAQQGHAEVIRALHAAEANVNTPKNDKSTPVYIAAKNGHAEVIRALHEAKANVNTQMPTGATPVYIAAENGHAEAIRVLHAAEANVNTPKNDKSTPVYIAAKNGHAEVIRALHEAGVNVNMPMPDGVTPIYAAASNGHAKVIAELHALEASMNAQNHDGATPVFIAAQQGHSEAIVALHAAGANVDTPMPTGATPVYIAAQQGHSEVIRALHEAGANVNTPALDGWAPVLALDSSWKPEVRDTFKGLGIWKGCPSINALTSTQNGWTPVFVAALMGRAEAIYALKAAGADVNIGNKDGETPIFIAAKMGHALVVTALLESGANANIKTNRGTALEQAKKINKPRHREVITVLEVHLAKYPNGIKLGGEENFRTVLTQYPQVATPGGVPNSRYDQISITSAGNFI